MATQAFRLQNPEIAHHAPPRPQRVSDLGVPIGMVRDLLLRCMFTVGSPTGMDLARILHLPFNGVVEQVMDTFIRDQVVNFKGGGAFGRATYEYLLTEKGRELAREAMERCSYVGPTPVPLDQYIHLVGRQTRGNPRVTRQELVAAMSDLVLDDDLIDRLGPAVNSMRSLFLYGPPGNGKTSIAERMARLLPGEVFVPYALSVENQIIQVFDPIVHKVVSPLGEDDPALRDDDLDLAAAEPTSVIGRVTWVPSWDERWALSRRPVIMTGGELTLDSLDLTWDSATRTYQAPFQLKSCEGLLLIDDFGRQKVHPRDLLNRWIVPLEKGVDYLTLRTGSKFEVPFNLLIIFSTNIDPSRLVDAAFLRRIRYKIEIKAPDEGTFRAIFAAECQRQNIGFEKPSLDHILETYYRKSGREPRCCHPRDILQLVTDISRFIGAKPALGRRVLDQACQTYFVHMEGDAPDAPPDPDRLPPVEIKARPEHVEARSVTADPDKIVVDGNQRDDAPRPFELPEAPARARPPEPPKKVEPPVVRATLRADSLASFDDDASPTVSIPVPPRGR